jgi:ABC-type amino acid transport substrate-binding protein
MQQPGWNSAWQLDPASRSTQTYLTLDQAYVALVNSEVDGVVDNRMRLTQAVKEPGVVRLLDDAVSPGRMPAPCGVGC